LKETSENMRLLGLDPGLGKTGWGIIESDGNQLSHVANGIVASDAKLDLASRLAQLHGALSEIVRRFCPDQAAIEETFVNQNPRSTLKLGQARGVALLVPAQSGIPVSEYAPNMIKKSVVGAGHAGKGQVQMMVSVLLPGIEIAGADAADALAVAICHAHHSESAARLAAAGGGR